MTDAPSAGSSPGGVPLIERVTAAVGELRPPRHPEHSDVAEWRAPTTDDIDAMLEVQVAADRVDHPSWTTPREDIADTFELAEFDHAHNSLIGFADDGSPVAVASVMRHPDTSERVKVYLNGAVHPQWRRRGIGAALVRWQYARGLQLLTANADTTLPGEFVMYANEHDLGNVAIAQSLGLRTARWFASMVRDMQIEIPELEVRDGIRFVQYSSDRAEDARLARNDAFRDHWGSLPSQPERWAQFVGGPFLRPDLSTLALAEDGRIVAFCLASVNEDDWETLGASNSYIDLIGVVRDQRGKGLAPRVIAHTLAAIAAAGLEKAVLDVDTDSPTGANTLYERLGFVATEREQALNREF